MLLACRNPKVAATSHYLATREQGLVEYTHVTPIAHVIAAAAAARRIQSSALLVGWGDAPAVDRLPLVKQKITK